MSIFRDGPGKTEPFALIIYNHFYGSMVWYPSGWIQTTYGFLTPFLEGLGMAGVSKGLPCASVPELIAEKSPYILPGLNPELMT